VAEPGISVSFSGFKEIDENLVRLGQVAGEKVMRSSLFAAMKPIQDRAVSGLRAIPNGSGALAKATRRVYLRPGTKLPDGSASSATRFVVAVAPKTKDSVAVALANLHYKRRKPIRGVIWGHLLEWGHRVANRSTGRLARSRATHSGAGRVRGLRIFTKAFEGGSLEAASIFRREIGKRVAAALRRAQRKAQKVS
jgi:hypothetical protein